MTTKLLSVAVAGVTLAISSPIHALTLDVDAADTSCDDSTGNPVYCSISAAVGAANPNDTVSVAPGVYEENVLIDVQGLTLVSTKGRSVTTIEGQSGEGALGAVQISDAVDGVQIGGVAQGFTIVGIDNGFPGIENAAVYFQGDHDGAAIIQNRIVADGDAGLLSEFGATNSGFLISENAFAGKTFLGEEPGGCGFGQQFILANVPRQLVTLGRTNTSDITFEKNTVIGRAGGPKPGCANGGQGNTLVTIDAANSSITHNVFAGDTARYGTSVRAREQNTDIANNSFFADGLADDNCHIFVEDVGATLRGLRKANEFDTAVLLLPEPNATSGAVCPTP